MNDDEKMFQIGMWLFGLVCLMAVALQVGYRTQNKACQRVHAKIVQVEHDTAVAQAQFAASVRPEILRNAVVVILPKVEPISFHKSISIDDIKFKEQPDETTLSDNR